MFGSSVCVRLNSLASFESVFVTFCEEEKSFTL